MSVTISPHDLADRADEIIEQVRDGQTVIMQSSEGKSIVLLDMIDYYILNALASYSTGATHPDQAHDLFINSIAAYMDKKISLGKLSEDLGMSRIDLQERFVQLGVPLRIGLETIDEAHDEVDALRKPRHAR
jgi:adenosyl cobinamide kinase/adenosyl cobinamide phosphate guanylyltransferase